MILKKLEFSDIEMLRMWRNSDNVKKYMEFKGYITIEMQKKWFESITSSSYYFVIYYDNYPIGLTEIKNINNGIGNLGIFIAEPEMLSVPMLAYKAIFTMLDFGFYDLNLLKIEASILKDNERAIRFNKALGFEIMENQEHLKNQMYSLSENVYSQKTLSLKKLCLR
ncbi:GNAT family N-acetyltransferase [Aliarcobacter cryaerophilus]|uniref:GNAT family N-acetyltransferase n=1 Tax=Aliarcobacter cryaerophilus TaxID=28198 RepID=UPI003DA23AA8